jgi:hypothetical protein
MQSKKFGNKYIVRIDKGKEVVGSLKKFCEENSIKLGSITAIGASDKITIGLFDTKTKEYHSKEFSGDYELAPVIGNITTKDGKIYLHLHANISDSEHKSFGGHLNSAIISGTFEAIIEVIEGKVEREFDEESGLNLFSFDKK